ncbi:ferrichrome ABC transporter substrate-binding protein [Yersinia kristensenii]|uniref:Ferrichrome ABC transporter substrate-binding protein n=1 Tax=Yersinia kristensenii TaxID=28152 RepID=A0AB73NJ91_YERKR|nr:energy transducer TonB [Yersinia kristensenii]OVZ80462.1 ferrichrome ABC transporter substrate-binding protein [Yersinia kristensenii]CNE76535.1 ferric siderophore transport system%2C periplasmic binding protein TonB [Yersinia kristensenii]
MSITKNNHDIAMDLPCGQPKTRWSISLLFGLGLHMLAAVLMLGWINKMAPQGVLPPAVMIELTLYQQAKSAPRDIPQGLQQSMAAPDDAPPEKRLEELPKLIDSPRGAHAIRPEKVVQKKKIEPIKPRTDTPLPVVAEKAAPTTSAPLPGDSHKNAATFSSAASAAISGKASWQSEVLAHLSRYKRYPREALRYRLEGISHVRFVVDHQGKVLTAELLTSSGAKILDREAMTLISRAQPLPSPPAELLHNGVIELIAPIAYNVKS